MQDFLVPELHAIKEQLKNLDSRLGELSARMDKQFERAEQRAETRQQELIRNLNLEGRIQH